MYRRTTFCLVLLLATSLLFISRASGEEKPKPKPAEKVEFVSGKITKVSAKSITISEHKQFADELTNLKMDDTTQVLLPPPEGSTGADHKPRNGKVTDLKKGDIVSASYKKDGMLATKITVAEPFKAHPKK